MSGPVAFYAPLKPPDHPRPSGDRRMARALIEALTLASVPVELASRLRSYDPTGDPVRQCRIQALGGRLAARLLRRYARVPVERRPRAWLTYHAYHKAPDWLGPTVTAALGIPYLLAEASVAPKQRDGPWAIGHAATERTIRAADLVLALTGVDAECLAPLVAPPAELRRLPPFLDPAPYRAARGERLRHRSELATRFGLDPAAPWLLAVAMMRRDVKRDSYLLLGRALARLQDRLWQLLVVGDGPARDEIAPALLRVGAERVRFTGVMTQAELPACYAAADLFVWPAVREAYGLAMLEAAASGVPVVAGRDGGVAEVVRDGVTGMLTPAGDPDAFAAATASLLDDPERRGAMGDRAARFVARERSLVSAAATLASAIEAARAIREARRDPGPAGPPRGDRVERERAHSGPYRRRSVAQRACAGEEVAPAGGLGGGARAQQPALPRARDSGASDRPDARDR
jgi:glycosyltransferase involved in cell wall biosynthesis